MRHLLWAAILLSSLSACAAPSPFVDLGLLSDADVERILRARTESVHSLSAELIISYDSPELSGTFDAVAYFQQVGRMRVNAFKDLILSVEPVFDLIVTPEGYALEVHDRDGAVTISERGAVDALADRHPRFDAFYWGREAFCLPGSMTAEPPTIIRQVGGGTVSVEGSLSSGASVRWLIDRSTLEVRSAAVHTQAGRTGVFHYSEYREVDGAFIPGRVVFEDPESQTRIDTRVVDVTVNPKIDPEVFDPAQVLGVPPQQFSARRSGCARPVPVDDQPLLRVAPDVALESGYQAAHHAALIALFPREDRSPNLEAVAAILLTNRDAWQEGRATRE